MEFNIEWNFSCGDTRSVSTAKPSCLSDLFRRTHRETMGVGVGVGVGVVCLPVSGPTLKLS